MNAIDRVRSEGRKILTEYESKIVLRSYGIPAVNEQLARNVKELRDAIRAIGFPLVLKGCAPEISHKSDLGLVAVDIRSEREAKAIFDQMMKNMHTKMPAVLVQEMVKGKREFVAGFTRDAQFGPTVMFGLGGIFTEVISDVVFRLAPFDRCEALQMVGEMKGRKMLEAVRGMEAVDLELLADILVILGEIALDHPDIKEIDVNPLIISGRIPIAVDALVVLS